MVQQFFTIDQEWHVETEVKKSRFLAYFLPYSQFEVRLAHLRQEHRKANHHVTAFRYLDQDHRVVEGCKDDGEPGGTAGMPMLQVLRGRALIDCAVIVTRYFGGTKLGTGGLSRAYAEAATAAIDGAALSPWVKLASCTLSVDFSQTAQIEKAIADHGMTVLNRTFTEDGLSLTLEGEEEAVAALKNQYHT